MPAVGGVSRRLSCRALPAVFKGGENALQVLPPVVDLIPEARLNLVIYHLRNEEVQAQGSPRGECPCQLVQREPRHIPFGGRYGAESWPRGVPTDQGLGACHPPGMLVPRNALLKVMISCLLLFQKIILSQLKLHTLFFLN